jgi:site-specific DNA-cytosine methylase
MQDRQPEVVFLENVKNLKGHDNGNNKCFHILIPSLTINMSILRVRANMLNLFVVDQVHSALLRCRC